MHDHGRAAHGRQDDQAQERGARPEHQAHRHPLRQGQGHGEVQVGEAAAQVAEARRRDHLRQGQGQVHRAAEQEGRQGRARRAPVTRGDVAPPQGREPCGGQRRRERGEPQRGGGEAAARQLRRVREGGEVDHRLAEFDHRPELGQREAERERRPGRERGAREQPEDRQREGRPAPTPPGPGTRRRRAAAGTGRRRRSGRRARCPRRRPRRSISTTVPPARRRCG